MSTNTALDDIGARIRACKPYDFGLRHANKLAHEDAPKLLAALEAVEALHRKVPVYVTEAGYCMHGADCESVEIDGESMCPDETEGYTCNHCAELNPDEHPDYPCSTIKAITEALR